MIEEVASSPDPDLAEFERNLDELTNGHAFDGMADYCAIPTCMLEATEISQEIIRLYKHGTSSNYEIFSRKANQVFRLNLTKFKGLLEVPIDKKERERKSANLSRMIELFEAKFGTGPNAAKKAA